MSFKLKKITGNQLFTPSLLLGILLVSFYISSIDLVEKTYNYGFILAVSGVVLVLKTYIALFGSLETNLKAKKGILAATLLLLGVVQFYLGFVSVDFLTIDKFPQNTVSVVLAAEVVFAVTLFLTKNVNLLKFSLVFIFLLFISTVSLYFKWFEKSPDLFILSQQLIAYIVIIGQTIGLFMTMNFYSEHREGN